MVLVVLGVFLSVFGFFGGVLCIFVCFCVFSGLLVFFGVFRCFWVVWGYFLGA